MVTVGEVVGRDERLDSGDDEGRNKRDRVESKWNELSGPLLLNAQPALDRVNDQRPDRVRPSEPLAVVVLVAQIVDLAIRLSRCRDWWLITDHWQLPLPRH